MAPVARELACVSGILEPIQTAMTLEGRIEELKTVLENHNRSPVTLIGFSWGAWLSFIFTARYPALVRKLFLVASGPFEEQYVPALHETSMSRLTDEEKMEFEAIIKALGNTATDGKDVLLARLGALASKTDTYEALPNQGDGLDAVCQRGDIFQSVWEVAAKLRRSGELLDFGKCIQCQVIAIHGDYDSHPAEGCRHPTPSALAGTMGGITNDKRQMVE